MDFYCVLSVSGSLASYKVQKENEFTYRAIRLNHNGTRDDIPAEVYIHKEDNGWQAVPMHAEIVNGLLRVIEDNVK